MTRPNVFEKEPAFGRSSQQPIPIFDRDRCDPQNFAVSQGNSQIVGPEIVGCTSHVGRIDKFRCLDVTLDAQRGKITGPVDQTGSVPNTPLTASTNWSSIENACAGLMRPMLESSLSSRRRVAGSA